MSAGVRRGAVTEERLLVFHNGEEGKIFVSRAGPGRYRIEDFFRFCLLSENFAQDVPKHACVGWVSAVEELGDGRLHVRRLVPEPNVDCVHGFLLPSDFLQSPEFEDFSNAIISRGGQWEVVGLGLFSAYVPK